MPTTRALVEDYVKQYFDCHPEQIHFRKLVGELRRLNPDAEFCFAEAVIFQKLSDLADRGWLERCGRGEYKKAGRRAR